MLNTDDFIKRLEILFDHYGFSAATFSDKIGVQRSGVSHLLSGRNKPSLDFIMKIVHYFPEVDLYWLLNGKGNLIKDDERTAAKFSHDIPLAGIPPKTISEKQPATEIEKIIILHPDGSFSEYKPQK